MNFLPWFEESFKKIFCSEISRRNLKTKGQYIFLYKFKELLACYNTEILNNDIIEINNKNVNIINDVINLYNIATNYISEDELYNIIINLSDISSYLNDLKNDNMDRYYELINCGLNIAKNNKIKSI